MVKRVGNLLRVPDLGHTKWPIFETSVWGNVVVNIRLKMFDDYEITIVDHIKECILNES